MSMARITREEAARIVEAMFGHWTNDSIVPKTLHTDKGKEYRPKQVGLTEFRFLLDQIYGPPQSEAEKIRNVSKDKPCGLSRRPNDLPACIEELTS